MSDDDPFSAFESDRTIIKPSAGRGPRGPASSDAAPGAAHAAAAPSVSVDLPAAAGLHPLVQAAAGLLVAATRLRGMPQHGNISALRASLGESVRRFEARARAEALPHEHVIAARYVLCTYVDECVSTTPWGGSGTWAAQSLLVEFHNESWGGEKVFQLMAKLAENVPANRSLLELIYFALSLGFQGRYRVLDNGRAQLDSVRERLGQLLRDQTGPVERELSPRWRGIAAKPVPLVAGIPIWVIGCGFALALLAIYVALRFFINAHTDDTFDALLSLDVPKATFAAAPQPLAAATPRLSTLLRPEIEAGALEVVDLSDRSVITIAGDGFFDAASAEVSGRVRPLLIRIGEALSSVNGSVLITGHTDSKRIRSLRFPSNWHLSQERANTVKAVLATRVEPARLRSEGRADSEPLADNETAEGRAQNRRVEITLMVSAQP